MAVRTPHFRVPFRLAGRSVAVVEQDTSAEIAQCVEAALRTPKGSRIDAPEFGIRAGLFKQLPPGTNADDVVAAVEDSEPRAELVPSLEIDGMLERIGLRLGVSR